MTSRVGDVADPSTYRPRPGEIPVDPGVYRFRDAHGRVIYVGKAKTLRSRLSSYFQDISRAAPAHPTDGHAPAPASSGPSSPPRSRRCSWSTPGSRSSTRGSTSSTATTSPTPTSRSRWARSSRGRRCMRGAKRKGTRYFGPYAHAWAIRETLDLLLRVFPVRTCSSGVFKRAGQVGRPCLLGYIDKCSAPVRRPGRRRRAPRHRRGLLRLHGRQHRQVRQAARAPDEGRRRRAWTTSRPPGCATTSARSTARWRSPPSSSPTPPTPTCSPSPRTSSRPRSRCSTSAAAGSAASAAGWSRRRAEDTAEPRRAPPAAGVRRRVRRRGAARGARARAAARPRPAWSRWLVGLRGAQVDLRVPQRGDKRP